MATGKTRVTVVGTYAFRIVLVRVHVVMGKERWVMYIPKFQSAFV